MAPILSLAGFGLAFESRVILRDINCEIAARGCTVLLGPAGTGKSTLLRTLAGLMAGHARLRLWGQVAYRGQPWGDGELPVLVRQKPQLLVSSVWENLVLELPGRARRTRAQQSGDVRLKLEQLGQEHLMEQLDSPVIDLPVEQQRIIAILRKAMAAPALLMVDEPTTNLKPEEAAPIIQLLKKLAGQTPLLVVSHHQGETRELAGQVILMADGVVQESAPMKRFFNQPQSAAAQHYLRTGSCPETGLNQSDEDAVPLQAVEPPVQAAAASKPPAQPFPMITIAPRDAGQFRSASYGPRGFVWLLDGLVAGTPQPGVLHDTARDLDSLHNVGITRLITLTETPFDPLLAAEHGIQCAFSPIPDMHAPSLSQTAQLCRDIDLFCADGEAVAVHCKAGLGRTGTLLAAYWIWHKQGQVKGPDAIAHIRRLEPRMIQSVEQEEFLSLFARELRTMSLTFQDQAEAVPAH